MTRPRPSTFAAFALLTVALGAPAAVASAQRADSLRTSVVGEASRMIGETEKNLGDVIKQLATVGSDAGRSMNVVLVMLQVSNGRVVARAETAAFRLDGRAASASGGVRVGPLLKESSLPEAAPLKPAEFIVGSVRRGTRTVSAEAILTDPASAFPDGSIGDGVVVAVLPADPAARKTAMILPIYVARRPPR